MAVDMIMGRLAKAPSNPIEAYAKSRHDQTKAKSAGMSHSNSTGIRISGNQDLSSLRDSVSSALREEAISKAKKKPGMKALANTSCCSPDYDYCSIENLTPTHVVYKQGESLYGRTYSKEDGKIVLGPKMNVNAEFVFTSTAEGGGDSIGKGKAKAKPEPDDDDDDDEGGY